MSGILDMVPSIQIVLFSVGEHMEATEYRTFELVLHRHKDIDPIAEWLLRKNIEGDILTIQEEGHRAAISYTGPDPRGVLLYPEQFTESYDNEGIILLEDRLEG